MRDNLRTNSHFRRMVPSACSGILMVAIMAMCTLQFATGSTPAADPAQYSSTCDHILKPAGNGTGPSVLCYLNATDEYTFVPTSLVVPAGSVVTFVIGHIGVLSHTFTIDSLSNDSTLTNWTYNPQVVTSQQLTQYFDAHTLISVPISGGGPFKSNATALPNEHGIYWFVSLVSGDFQQGMFGALYEGVNLPSPSTQPLTVTVETVLLIAGFIVLSIVAIYVLSGLVTGGKPVSPEKPEEADQEKDPETQPETPDPGGKRPSP